MTPLGGWGGLFQIGARTDANEFFGGEISDVAVWGTARSASQILADSSGPPNTSDPNLKGYWPLNEGSGTVAHDQTSNGNNGMFAQARTLTQGVPGALTDDSDTAYSFSGQSIDLSLPQLNTAVGTDNSVSFWMDWNGTQNVIPVGFLTYDLYIQGGYIGFNTGQGDIYGTSSAGLANGWHFITAVFHNGDATQSQLYIDGVKQTLSQSFGTTNTNREVTTEARISSWVNDNNYGFQGSLDEVAFYNRALTQSEVTTLYNARSSTTYPATVLATNPIGYYRLDETSGTKVVDSSPYHNDGDFGLAPNFEPSGAFLYSTAPSPITITVINTADSGPGSLRQALLDANAIPFPVPITIDFNIPSGDPGHVAGSNGGYYLIQPVSPLPTVTRPDLTIDGRSQVAFDGDTNSNPEIVLDGQDLNTGNGLQLNSSNDVIDGLDIERFLGYGIYINGTSNNWIWGNYIGVDPTGTLAEGNANGGVYVSSGSYNLIGTNGAGVNDAAERNVISGNGGSGVTLSGLPYYATSLETVDQIIAGVLPSVQYTGTMAQADVYDPTEPSSGFTPPSWTYDNVVPGGGGDYYSFNATGTFNVTTTGTYSFALGSDDGSRLTVDGKLVGEFDGGRAFAVTYATVTLSAGSHTFSWVGFQIGGQAQFELSLAAGTNTSVVSTANGWYVLGDPNAPIRAPGPDGRDGLLHNSRQHRRRQLHRHQRRRHRRSGQQPGRCFRCQFFARQHHRHQQQWQRGRGGPGQPDLRQRPVGRADPNVVPHHRGRQPDRHECGRGRGHRQRHRWRYHRRQLGLQPHRHQCGRGQRRRRAQCDFRQQ